MNRDDGTIESSLADALRRLKGAAEFPAADPTREAALLAAFDAAHDTPSRRGERHAPGGRRDLWYLSAFAAAAMVLIAIGVAPSSRDSTGRHGPLPGGAAPYGATSSSVRGAQPGPPNEFVLVPGAAALPPMESGTLVRLDLPVSMLPSYGVTPPPGRTTLVTMDVVVAQDGLARAVRIVD